MRKPSEASSHKARASSRIFWVRSKFSVPSWAQLEQMHDTAESVPYPSVTRRLLKKHGQTGCILSAMHRSCNEHTVRNSQQARGRELKAMEGAVGSRRLPDSRCKADAGLCEVHILFQQLRFECSPQAFAGFPTETAPGDPARPLAWYLSDGAPRVSCLRNSNTAVPHRLQSRSFVCMPGGQRSFGRNG